MIAKLAYLTTPSPGRYILNIQTFGSDDLLRYEIDRAHLANILIDGTAVALREYPNRVPAASQPEDAHGDDRRQQPA